MPALNYATYEGQWPPTPASSSATILPPRSVASFKSYDSEEPERGRSLSRSSSGSSSGVLVLASPSSIDSDIQPENLQHVYGYPRTNSALVASSLQQSADVALKALNPEVEDPILPTSTTSQDLLGLDFPPVPISPMDPQGPTAVEMGIFGPRSPLPSPQRSDCPFHHVDAYTSVSAHHGSFVCR
ncbi:hypothetical protein B0H12DRAFT_649971 [Mycena haematopus]|nr:hypothetical protein B0H12DRAFT_649971 [Mycena haematopus]